MFFKLSLALTLDTHFLGACLGSASFKFNVRRLQRLSERLFTACNYEAIIYLELVKIFRFQLWCYCSAHYLVTIVGSSNLSQDTLDCLIRLCVNHFKVFPTDDALAHFHCNFRSAPHQTVAFTRPFQSFLQCIMGKKWHICPRQLKSADHFLEAIHVTRFQFISAAATFFEESVPRMEL